MKKTITYLLGSAAMIALVFVASCSDDESLPPIDGYNNSNEVASSNLLAHWTFDNTNEEDISGLSPLTGDAGTFGTVGFYSPRNSDMPLPFHPSIIRNDIRIIRPKTPRPSHIHNRENIGHRKEREARPRFFSHFHGTTSQHAAPLQPLVR